MAIKINKKIIFSLIVVLILVGGGFFWWQKNRETPIEKWDAAEVSPEEDYIAKETPEGKIVENKKMGLIYEIPKDWILQEGNPTIFYGPDIKFRENSSIFLEKGCKIDIYASYIITNINTLKKFIDEDFSKLSLVMKIDEFSTIEVSDYSALRYKYHSDKFRMSSISVNFPSEDKLYKIMLSSPIGEIESCEVEFDKFLETVSIK